MHALDPQSIEHSTVLAVGDTTYVGSHHYQSISAAAAEAAASSSLGLVWQVVGRY